MGAEETKRWRKHAPDEVVAILADIERRIALGASVSQAVAAAGIAEATYFRWRKRYEGMTPAQISRMRALEAEVERLRKVVGALDARGKIGESEEMN